jgi:hypothetical protein
MMKWDIEDVLCVAFILALIGLGFFIFKQSSNMSACHERGGTVVNASGGWVCAKLEKV